MSKLTLGISAYYHDSAITISHRGKILFAASEERYSRKKHDKSFPSLALKKAIDYLNINVNEIENVIFYDKPYLKLERLLDSYFYNSPFGLKFFLNSVPSIFNEKLFIKSTLRKELKKVGIKKTNLLFSEHHLSHAASAFLPSPFERANILCADGVGEWATTTSWVATNEKIEPQWEIRYPHSLGLLYSAFTYYCGFKVNSGEYKLMGLAPYGKPKFVELIKEHFVNIDLETKTFSLNLDCFSFDKKLVMISKRFEDLLGYPARNNQETIDQHYKDVAASIQKVLEEIMLILCLKTYEDNPCENLVLAGGVALNCVMNTKLFNQSPYEKIWIQPAAGDAGGSLGAALYQDFISGQVREAQSSSFLGNSYSAEEVEAILKELDIPHKRILKTEKVDLLRNSLLKNKIIGWYQGKMEFGPRALGNRSILARADNPEMKDILNQKIKKREGFRPFAPMVSTDKFSQYFDQGPHNEFMLFTANVTVNNFPAITHLDNSARVQVINEKNHPELFQALSTSELEVIVNTSFNVRGEPIVESPTDAIKSFFKADLDILFIEEFYIEKFPINEKIQNLIDKDEVYDD
tara:strand:+ start:79201 stop:80937 length:1737 start_codon:yes stop_codon:yes gene_type:complete